MFGIIVIAAVVIGGGIIAAIEVNKTTGEKVKTGDSVFVPLEQLTTVNPVAQIPLRAFLTGFTSLVAKVSGVIPGATPSMLTGNIVGFPDSVTFPRNAVASIDRNGSRIV